MAAAVFVMIPSLIVPLCVLPSVCRSFLVGAVGWTIGLILSDLLGSVFCGLGHEELPAGNFVECGVDSDGVGAGIVWTPYHGGSLDWGFHSGAGLGSILRSSCS